MLGATYSLVAIGYPLIFGVLGILHVAHGEVLMAGAFMGHFLVQMWGARRIGMTYRPVMDLRNSDLLQYLRLTLPLMAGLTMMFSMEIFIKYFGIYLPEGNVSALEYSRTIILIPVGLFGQAVGMASFPFMARLAVENRIPEMNRLMNTALRYLALVIPFSIMLIVVRHELVQLIYGSWAKCIR